MKRKNEIAIPQSWEELEQQQFAEVAKILYHINDIEVPQLRLLLFCALTGKNIVSGNGKANCLQRMAELTGFMFTITANDDILNIISDRARELLKFCTPSEIQEIPVINELRRVIKMLGVKIDLNLHLKYNYFPVKKINRVSFHGPTFNIDENGVLETDICAGEFTDAMDYASLMYASKNNKYLSNIAACFYRPSRKGYSTFESQNNAKFFNETDGFNKSVLLMFTAWRNYFTEHEIYGILFSHKDDSTLRQAQGSGNNKIELGSAGIMYALSKDGYGSMADVANMPICDYFNLQIKNLQDCVASYRNMKKSDAEISVEMKLDIDIIRKL